MKTTFTILLFIFCIGFLSAQAITGQWKTVDDETGEEKSIVEIYEADGKIYGKIVELLNPSSKNPICDKCKGSNKNKPIVGMVIINGLTKDDDVYEDGTILDPSNGKVYTCKIKLGDDTDTLQVRGYVAFFYKTQYWKRIID